MKLLTAFFDETGTHDAALTCVGGYAEASGSILTIHSDRCSKEKFDGFTRNEGLESDLKQRGFSMFVYTNDKDLKFSYDLGK